LETGAELIASLFGGIRHWARAALRYGAVALVLFLLSLHRSSVNLFANHIWFFGNQHAALTIGTDCAARMDGCRSAMDAGVYMANHSDAPVTPMAGTWRGASISVDEALYAITMGAAYRLKRAGELGSIPAGKRAHVAVLGDDPTAVDPIALKDVAFLGTDLGGQPNLLN